MNKKILLLGLMFAIKLLVTSCIRCNCDPVKQLERTYTGIDLKAWDNAGFQSNEIVDSVYKNAFGLSVSVNFDLKEISEVSTTVNLNFLRFSTAQACSCTGDRYINVDPINTIEISVIDTDNQIESIVTDNFFTYGYDNKLITISELFENRAEWHDGFQLDLSDFQDIPNSSIFIVKIKLQSGYELTNQTEEIKFK